MTHIITLLTITLLGIPTMTPLQDAVWAVESSRSTEPGIVGDGGKAIGPLQIHRSCWLDVKKADEKYEDCYDLEYSLRVFERYMARYAKPSRLGRAVTDIDRARIWNGGPNGYKKDATITYANKIKKVLD